MLAPPYRPPVFLMSPISDLINSAYSSPSGSRQNFSPDTASAASNFACVASSFEKTPAVVLPRATEMAPVSVAASIKCVAPSCRA